MTCYPTLVPVTNVFGFNVFSGKKEFFLNNYKGVINTISPHSYIEATNDRIFSEALLSSDYLIPDGIGIVFAIKVLTGKKIVKISGSELHDIVINTLNNRKGSCFYLGSTHSTLQKIKERMNLEQSEVKVNTLSPPFKDNFSQLETDSMISIINEFNPDVLFVGMTAPKQEKWVYENRNRINAATICSIGAVFDFYAGTVKRPGKFWIILGLEWLPRLLREPRRLWRRTLISAPRFIWHVLQEKIRISKIKN